MKERELKQKSKIFQGEFRRGVTEISKSKNQAFSVLHSSKIIFLYSLIELKSHLSAQFITLLMHKVITFLISVSIPSTFLLIYSSTSHNKNRRQNIAQNLKIQQLWKFFDISIKNLFKLSPERQTYLQKVVFCRNSTRSVSTKPIIMQ